MFVQCPNMGICAETFGEGNKVGALPQLPKVELTGSQASSYGNALATQPNSIKWLLKTPHGSEIVPGRETQLRRVMKAYCQEHDVLGLTEETTHLRSMSPNMPANPLNFLAAELRRHLDQPTQSRMDQFSATLAESSSNVPQQLVVAVEPVDSLGTVTRGMDFIVQVRVCRTRGECTAQSSLLPAVFQPCDKMTGISSSSFQLECPIGENEVALEVELVGFAHVPVLKAMIRCGKCRPGESKKVDSASKTWFCVTCADNQYVVDPNNAAHSCQACPTGGSCNGSAFTPLPGKCFSKSLYIVSLFSEYSRPLTFENLCQAQSGSETTLQVSTVL